MLSEGKVAMNISVTKEQKQILHQHAARHGRSLSNYVMWRLKDEFREKEYGTDTNSENSPENGNDAPRRRSRKKAE